jgi:hypothetical protein
MWQFWRWVRSLSAMNCPKSWTIAEVFDLVARSSQGTLNLMEDHLRSDLKMINQTFFLMIWEVGTSLQRMGGRSRVTACEDFIVKWYRSAICLIHLNSCLLPFLCSLSKNCPKGKSFQDIEDNEKNITCTVNTFLWMPSVTMLYNS